jgi:hypothetical protein
VIDRDTYLCLQDVIRREGRSFLQYADESFPWTTSADGTAVQTLRTLAVEEREATAALSRFLARNRLSPPYLGAYPSYFTCYNYMSVAKLVPLLVQHQQTSLAALERDLAGIHDADARLQVQQVVEMKQRHLKSLEILGAPAGAA